MQAAGWEDGVVISDAQDAADVPVLSPESPVDSPLHEPFEGAPVEAVAAPISPLHGEVAAHPTMTGESADSWRPEAVPRTCGLATPCEICPRPASCGNARWAFRSDAILLWRNAPSSRPIYSTIDPSTGGLGPTALNAHDLNSDMLAAPRLSLLRTDCEGQTLEATYMYAGNFYSDQALPFSRDGYLTSPPGIYGNSWGLEGTSLSTGSATLLGQLQSLELNVRHCLLADTCHFLMGARWLQWNETLQMYDSFSAPPPPEPITLQGTDVYQTRCFNNLWGGQIGLDTLLLGRVGQARVDGLVKAGAYYNGASQTSAYTYATVPEFVFSEQNRSDRACGGFVRR